MIDSHTKDPLLLFGARVKQLRKTASLSQEQLAMICELDRTYVGGVERGERNISLRNIIKIAKALNIESYKMFIDE